jgi:uncharacterized protein YxeA
MVKRILIALLALAVLILAGLLAYPFVEIDTGEKLIRCSYSDDFSAYDRNHSYNEAYCYYEKRDVSIRTFAVKKFWFFYTIHMEYVKGDVRKTQFVLEESYIQSFLSRAVITDNESGIDLAALIEGREAVVGNTRYHGNDERWALYYELDGEYGEMYIYYADDLLVIQVGSPDEQPRFIAYR